MGAAVSSHLGEASVVLMAAAVADFQPTQFRSQKIKKRKGAPSLKLKPTRDILGEITRQRRPNQLVVGFAAETENVIENAAQKLKAKRLAFIVANDVTQEGAGFEADTNIVTLLFPDGRQKPLEKMTKLEVANRILDEVVELRKSGGQG
jgi:phosphopantothenoylcysteine decarboxylase/phosphopantothenate--cysteine ligase